MADTQTQTPAGAIPAYRRMRLGRTRMDVVFEALNYTFLAVIGLVTLYPFWEVFIVSVSSYESYLSRNFHLITDRVDLSAYRFILRMPGLWQSYRVTLFVTAVGTTLSVTLTTLTGYVLSKDYIRGRRVIMFLIVFTMLFSGGLIPLYIVVRQTGLMNTPWALMVPQAILTFNLIIMRNFFFTMPDSLEESARMDGASDLTVLVRIVIPLSMPVMSTIALFYGVRLWNDFFGAVMYISDRSKWPLQLFLRAMLFDSEASLQSGGDDPSLLGQPIKMATVTVAMVPIMAVYPFFQRYFVRGIMIGAVKG